MAINESDRHSTRELAEQWVAEGRDPRRIELINLLRRAVERTSAEPDRVLAEHGLSRGQFDVLAALRRSGADRQLTQAELAAHMMVSPAGMKKRLDGLYARGILTRSSDGLDARRLLIRLTAEGDRLVDDVLDAFFSAEYRSVAALSEVDQDELVAGLRKLLGEVAG